MKIWESPKNLQKKSSSVQIVQKEVMASEAFNSSKIIKWIYSISNNSWMTQIASWGQQKEAWLGQPQFILQANKTNLKVISS